jgi:hypothetical protein
MSNEYQDWLAEERWEDHLEQQRETLLGTDEDLELWSVIMEMSDFIKKRGAQVLIDNLPREVYDPIAKYVHNDYAKMQLKVMSNKLQREAVCKDSY